MAPQHLPLLTGIREEVQAARVAVFMVRGLSSLEVILPSTVDGVIIPLPRLDPFGGVLGLDSSRLQPP